MAYSGGLHCYQLTMLTQANDIVLLNAGIDLSATSADAGTFMVPIPFLLLQFGVFVQEDLGVVTGSVFLERANGVTGTDTTVIELDLDSTDLKSGDNKAGLVTASSGGAAIDAGDVVFSSLASFPILIEAPQYLTVRHVLTAVGGEVTPFIVGRWQGIDLRSTRVWGNTA